MFEISLILYSKNKNTSNSFVFRMWRVMWNWVIRWNLNIRVSIIYKAKFERRKRLFVALIKGLWLRRAILRVESWARRDEKNMKKVKNRLIVMSSFYTRPHAEIVTGNKSFTPIGRMTPEKIILFFYLGNSNTHACHQWSSPFSFLRWIERRSPSRKDISSSFWAS